VAADWSELRVEDDFRAPILGEAQGKSLDASEATVSFLHGIHLPALCLSFNDDGEAVPEGYDRGGVKARRLQRLLAHSEGRSHGNRHAN